MNKQTIWIAVLISGLGAAGWWLIGPEGDGSGTSGRTATSPAGGDAIVQVTMPETLSPQARIGKRGFEAKCATCHGETGGGRAGKGPPLVHKYYEPSHHGDAAFLLAAQNGVRSHHWNFGDMPPVGGVTRSDVIAITAYVRELQRQNGIN